MSEAGNQQERQRAIPADAWLDALKTADWGQRLAGALVLFMAAVAAFFLYVSLYWRPYHDSQIMFYIGFLMERADWVPYRDIFDMNPPGTHLLHSAVVRGFGTSDFAQRMVDLVWLLATEVSIFAFLRRWGSLVAASAASMFAIQYLSGGAGQVFQREYLCVLPLCASLVVAFRWTRGPLAIRAFAVGVLHGGVATIKPFLAAAFPVVLLGLVLYDAGSRSDRSAASLRSYLTRREMRLALLAGILGVSVVPFLCLLYLWKGGALGAFLDIAQNYWPLYASLRGDASVRIDPFEPSRFFGLLESSGAFLFFGIAAIGVYFCVPALLRKSYRDRVEMWVLFGSALAFHFYLYLSGKFWTYHAIPLYFVGSLFAGMALWRIASREVPMATRVLRVAAIAFLFVLPLRPPDQAGAILSGQPYRIHPDIDYIAGYLREHLEPGDVVQPLDVTAGAVHAMLRSGALVATPFLYDVHFYHHPETPYIESLRARLIRGIEESRPRYIIAATASTWRPRGPGSGRFAELSALLARDYRELWVSSRLTLYDRREP